jgi:urease accessory protein
MAWHANLQLDYRLESGKTVVRHTHTGPLRVLQSLYPEGDAVCHNVLVHPPAGLVGGDTLGTSVNVASGAHCLITTPGATRFYRSGGDAALQNTQLALAPGARMEWLPLEAILHSGCLAESRLTMTLAPGAELMGWDVTALGLPLANQPFVQGHFLQHIEVPGVWMERGILDAADTRLLDGPVGLAGHRCMASLFFITGIAMDRDRKQAALDCARALISAHPLAGTAGITSPHPQVIVARVLAPVVEPAIGLLRNMRKAWRSEMWAMEATEPRIWAL